MVDIGISPGTTEMARLVVDEVSGTLAIVGAGVAGGPSRRVDVFEDMRVRGNLQVGEMRAVRARWEQGVDGAIHAGADDEVPRVEKLAGDPNLHMIGGGPLGGPNRNIVIHDNLNVANDVNVEHDVAVGHDLAVRGAIEGNSVGAQYVTGVAGVAAGTPAGWTMLYGQNMVYAAGTFHLYDRGGGVICKQCCGYGFDASTPITFAPNVNYLPFGASPLAGVSLVRVMLDAPVMQGVICIESWHAGLYDETTPPGILPLFLSSGGWLPLNHDVVIKGIADRGGATPMGPMAHQIEVLFSVMGTPFVPVPGTDLVFDIVVIGYPSVIL